MTKIRHNREQVIKAMRDAAKESRPYSQYDAVDLASDTGNYFWIGLSNRECAIALRAVRMSYGKAYAAIKLGLSEPNFFRRA